MTEQTPTARNDDERASELAMAQASNDPRWPRRTHTAPNADDIAEAQQTIQDALLDSQYLAGVTAGWNAAQDVDAEAALASLQKSRSGHLSGFKAAKQLLADRATASGEGLKNPTDAMLDALFPSPGQPLYHLERMGSGGMGWVADRVEQRRRFAKMVAALPASQPVADVEKERDEARKIVRDIHWMARRYADGRQSYAVGMCNDALKIAYDAGWLEHKIGGEAPFARDSMFSPEWKSIEQQRDEALSQVATLTARVVVLEGALARAGADILLTPRHNRDGAADKHIEESRGRIRAALASDPAGNGGEASATTPECEAVAGQSQRTRPNGNTTGGAGQ